MLRLALVSVVEWLVITNLSSYDHYKSTELRCETLPALAGSWAAAPVAEPATLRRPEGAARAGAGEYRKSVKPPEVVFWGFFKSPPARNPTVKQVYCTLSTHPKLFRS